MNKTTDIEANANIRALGESKYGQIIVKPQKTETTERFDAPSCLGNN